MAEDQKKKIINDYEREPVPENERKGWLRLMTVWLGISIALSATVLGGTLGSGLSFPQAMAATFIGTFILAAGSALCSVIGSKTGLSTSLIARFALGKYGSYLVSVIIAISLFGWFGVQLNLFGTSFQNVIQNIFGITLNAQLLVVVGGILMTTTAMIGYKAIEKLSIAAVPLMCLLLFASLWRVMQERDLAEVVQAPLIAEPLQLGVAISMVVGSLAVGAVIAPDISRYAKSSKHAVFGAFTGLFVGYSLVLVIAAILAKATQETDIVSIMLGLGWGTSAMLILILAQWTTNDSNLYSSALGFAVIFKRVPKFVLTIIAGAIGTILSILGIYEHFTSFLNFLSVLIPPIGGIYGADYLLNRSKYHFKNLDKMKNLMFIGMTSWVLSSTIAFMTTPAPVGFGLFEITKAPGLDAFLLAFVFQCLFIFMHRRFQRQTDLPEYTPKENEA
ncbi:cytosine permease [Terribacillus saccharophilus]|uniref:cytosine permease n=1 Tax=Terribacillus saccharophilus TaxID=361277 RepID=UPI0039828FD8